MAPKSRLAAILTLGLAAAGVACGDIAGPQAVLQTIADTSVVYALNGAPPGAPTALYLFAGTTVRADANFRFDVAFDIAADGKVILMPVRTVASPLTSAHQVGLQTVATSYDALETAPSSGYRKDSTLVVSPNTVVVIEAIDPFACSNSFFGTTTYAKLVVDKVDPVARTIDVRFVIEPNCGYHSFKPGIPKNPKD
jgi:hypothetical protein